MVLPGRFKVTQKLTLNLGLRYELLFGTTERYNQSNLGFDTSVANPIEDAAKTTYARSPIPELSASDFRVKGGLFFATPDRRGNVNLDKTSFSPRIGAAYRVMPKPSSAPASAHSYSVWWQPFVRATGFASNTAMVTTLDGGLTPRDTLSNPFPGGLVQPTGASLGLRTLLGSSIAGTYDYWHKPAQLPLEFRLPARTRPRVPDRGQLRGPARLPPAAQHQRLK